MANDDNKTKSMCDVLIIGAGIQGVGVAQAAALQGWKVHVLEQYDQAAMGTSSKSSKLIHGGLRYLETAQFSLVKECLEERQILQRVAPNLVKPIRFIIPVYNTNKRAPVWIKLGLWLYGLLGDAKPKTLAKETWSRFHRLSQKGLKAVFSYEDAQTDDKKLTEAVLNSAIKMGASISFNSEVTNIAKTESGFSVVTNNNVYYTKVLINAAGPWVNLVRDKSKAPLPSMDVDLVQGTHIVVDSPSHENCFYLESPDDGRAMFVLPWMGKTMVGTTEKNHSGDPANSKPTDNEINYLKRGFDHYFPSLADAPILESFSGLRVLPKNSNNPTKRVRDTKIISDENMANGYYAIYGGKLTGYRATAEKVIKKISHHFLPSKKIISTKDISLE